MTPRSRLLIACALVTFSFVSSSHAGFRPTRPRARSKTTRTKAVRLQDYIGTYIGFTPVPHPSGNGEMILTIDDKVVKTLEPDQHGETIEQNYPAEDFVLVATESHGPLTLFMFKDTGASNSPSAPSLVFTKTKDSTVPAIMIKWETLKDMGGPTLLFRPGQSGYDDAKNILAASGGALKLKHDGKSLICRDIF